VRDVAGRWSSALGRVAGVFALASGCAYIAYLVPIGGGDWAITAWNLLIIPTALSLGARAASGGSLVSAIATGAGVAASLLWAFAYASPALEAWWIGLAAVWWLGVGWLLRTQRPALGWFTLLLSLATMVDFVLTALNAPMPIYALGGLKIPLTIVWTFWIGVSLVRGPGSGTPGRDTLPGH
jgi:hypothetical protein